MKSDTKSRIVSAAAELFQKQGYAATGTAQILELADSPKGSMYFHFPDGKEQLATAAVSVAALEMEVAFQSASSKCDSSADLVLALGKILGRWMTKSDFEAGCPITTITLEQVPRSVPITNAIRRAFETWEKLLVDEFVQRGIKAERAARLSRVVLAAFEGCFILARAQQDAKIFHKVAEEIVRLFDD